MSFQASVSKLQPPVRDLVLTATRDAKELVGRTEADEKEVIGWIDKTSQGNLVTENNLKDLDTILIPKTYLATNYLTAADIALYGTLHPIVAKLQSSEYYAVPSVTRYFDHVQAENIVRTSAGEAFKVILLDIKNAPAPERKVEAPKKKEKAPKAAATPDAPAMPTEPATPASEPADKGQKKEKKEKKKDAAAAEGGKDTGKKAGGKAATKAPAADEGEPVPSMIDLRVGHIVDIMKHPDADGLYVEQIDIGEETGPRTVVSGLVNYIPIDQMRDKYLVAVCNLKPANMRGVKSFAMVLCATSKEGKEGGIELIQPPPGSKPGDRIYFEGAEFENAIPLTQLNPKKKIFETIQPGFITLDTKEAAWVNPVTKVVHKIRSEKGVCVAPTLVGASLS
ncbi:nucleic acid-binding protein [Pholiota conissans]|uniref:Nucleic acid-binding protein n=1 Tax=Pholiota conissans TaxID=109636 RepID=A0A9P6D2Z2_9AGAR|nr:nucleic acid-binding protein [Pholiota conissans]